MQFLAVIRLFPSTQRLGVGGKPGVQSEIANQTIDWQSRHVAAIPFLCILERTIQKANLSHREWPNFRRDVFAGKFERRFERRNLRRCSAALFRGGRLERRLLGQRYGRRGGQRTEGTASELHLGFSR